MSANLVANVTISGNLRCFSTHFAKTTNVATGFAIGGPYINASYGARIAGGSYHTAVIMQNGSVRMFGNNTFGQLGLGDTMNRLTPVQVPGITGARAVACGRRFTAVLQNDGTVRMFGSNPFGCLGVGDSTSRQTPVQVFGISAAVAVACGGSHTAVVSFDGRVSTFGYNLYGQLGLGDTLNRNTPVQGTVITSATAVACGSYHTAVILANGTVRTFGINTRGCLGVGDTATRNTPVQVFGISSSATAVACGTYHTVVLLSDGTVRSFGTNSNGELGVGDTTSRLTPVQVTGITSATAIACKSYTSTVLLADGTVRAFGKNNNGQLGVNDLVSRLTPVQVFGISSSASALGCGSYYAAVILTDGSVRTFGANDQGQLGVNDTTSRLTPVQVVAVVPTFSSKVACGQYFTAVLLADGTVRTFGQNADGQLGVNDTTSRLTPVQVFGISSSATAIACGGFHTAVLLTNGTVRTFGRDANGQLGISGDSNPRQTPVQVFGISSSATAVACGRFHTTVLLADGTVRTFGYNNFGQLGVNDTTTRNTPVQVLNISIATAVASGNQHTAVLLADGTVRTFGRNDFGQLGVNDTTSRLTPVQVFGISSSAVAVACGTYNTAILLADGTVRTFGTNTNGQLGIDVNGGTRQTPVQVFGISSSATAVACGQYHTIVLLADGTVRAFGFNSGGQLGVNDTTSRQTPVQVFGISSSATAVACGVFLTAVLLADGTVRTFGRNLQGQLGVNDTTSRLTPVQVLNITTAVTPSPVTFLTSAATSITLAASAGQIWTSSATGVARTLAGSVAGGSYHTAVVLKDGTVRTFGQNGNGQLGAGDTTTRLTPVQVSGITSATAVAGGFQHTATLLADGTVRTFGKNNFGQLGVNDTTSRQTPVQVFGISSSAVAVACGEYFTAVLLSDGTVRTFGYNNYGQLGVGDATNRSTPVTVLNISTATAVAVSGSHTAVLLANGTVRTFGYNAFGELGVNDTTTRQTPVQVFGISSSATAIACGYSHTAVILADGTVRTFGRNQNAQLGLNDTTQRNTPVQVFGISSSATAVACGDAHTTVLLADGTVRTFGRNTEGQLGVNDTTTRFTPVQVFGISSSATAIACGAMHTTVLLMDGTVRTFGRNAEGQLGVNDTTNRSTPVSVFGLLGTAPFTSTYVTAKGLALGLSAPTFQLDLSTDKARKLSTTTWTTGSDSRIKSDIQSANLARCVDIVDSLDLKYFKWDIPGVPGPTDSHSLGWIAQDVKEFFPNSVRQTQDYGFDDFHNLDSDQLIKTMYGALKKMCQDTYGQ